MLVYCIFYVLLIIMLFANINAECRTPTTFTYGVNTQSIDLRQLGNFLRSRLPWSFLEDEDLLGRHPSGFGAAIGCRTSV